MEKRYVVLGIGILALFGQMMAPIPFLLGAPFIVVGLWFIAWGMLGKPFQDRVNLTVPPLSATMRGFDGILDKLSGAEVISEDQRASLEVSGPLLKSDPAHITFNSWRMQVTNRGPTVAGNVKMKLLGAVSGPRSGLWKADFPYDVRRVTHDSDVSECKLNKGESQDFKVVAGWQNAEGAIFTSGMDARTKYGEAIGIEPDERWELRYELTADRSDPIQFTLLVYVEDGTLIAKRNA